MANKQINDRMATVLWGMAFLLFWAVLVFYDLFGFGSPYQNENIAYYQVNKITNTKSICILKDKPYWPWQKYDCSEESNRQAFCVISLTGAKEQGCRWFE